MKKNIDKILVMCALSTIKCFNEPGAIVFRPDSSDFIKDTLYENGKIISVDNYFCFEVENRSEFDTISLPIAFPSDKMCVLPNSINETAANGELWHSIACNFSPAPGYAKIPKGKNLKIWLQINGFNDTASLKEYVFSLFFDRSGITVERQFIIASGNDYARTPLVLR